jgi:hypothetical protein
MKVVLGVVVIASTVVVFAGAANAGTVALDNPSFEQPALPAGGMLLPSDNPQSSIQYPFAYTLASWSVGDQNVVIWHPTSSDFPGSPGTLPGTATGQQCLLNIGANDDGILQVVPGITIQPHESFTLTVAFGNPMTYGFTDDALAFAYQDPTDPTGQTGNLLQNQDTPITMITTLSPGTFKDESFTINTDDWIVPGAQPGDTDEYGNPVCAAGDNMIIAIELGNGGALDNVRLTSPQVPEPSTLLLLTTGLISLLAYAWRRRRMA